MEIIKDKEIYNSKCGIEVEFIRNPKITRTEIKKQLQKILSVNISLEDGAHSDFVPTDVHWKIEQDFSGGEYTLELVTGPLEYNHARIVLIKCLRWIRETPYIKTTPRCGLHLNINFPDTRYIQDIDMLKFILNFDEKQVYDRFPKREDNLYTKSIKDIVPLHTNFDFKNISTNRTSFVYPSSKYYGINFDKLKHNYLEFRYIGGSGYEKQQSDILYLLDFFILSIKDSYYKNDDGIKEKLIEILEPKKQVFLAGQSLFNFKNIFKNLEIRVDNKTEEEVLKLCFPIIWKEILPIFIKAKDVKFNMKGIINYDTDNSCIEMSGLILRRTIIENPRVLCYDCRLINVVVINSLLFDCAISNSDLKNSNADGCEIKESRVKESQNSYTKFTNCYLDGVDLVNSQVDRGIFRKGTHTNTEIEENVEVIDKDVENLDETND